MGLVITLLVQVATACSAAPDFSRGASAPPAPTPLPAIPGLSTDEVASLATLVQVDGHPFYVMHLHGDAAIAREGPAGGSQTQLGFSCSLLAAFGDDATRLYGRNFDWDYSPALLLYVHPPDGHDSVSMVDIGYDVGRDGTLNLADAPLAARRILLDALEMPFDGMNARGLAVGMAAVPDSTLPHDATLPTIGSLGIIREMLDHAATVDEAVALMRHYNVAMSGGPQIHYLIADASGASALVEYYAGEMVVFHNIGPWHAATNHFIAPLDGRTTYACDRYARLAEVLSASAGRLTPASAMDLLAEVAQPSTQWSIVYDLVTLQLHVAIGRDYGDAHTMTVGQR